MEPAKDKPVRLSTGPQQPVSDFPGLDSHPHPGCYYDEQTDRWVPYLAPDPPPYPMPHRDDFGDPPPEHIQGADHRCIACGDDWPCYRELVRKSPPELTSLSLLERYMLDLIGELVPDPSETHRPTDPDEQIDPDDDPQCIYCGDDWRCAVARARDLLRSPATERAFVNENMGPAYGSLFEQLEREQLEARRRRMGDPMLSLADVATNITKVGPRFPTEPALRVDTTGGTMVFHGPGGDSLPLPHNASKEQVHRAMMSVAEKTERYVIPLTRWQHFKALFGIRPTYTIDKRPVVTVTGADGGPYVMTFGSDEDESDRAIFDDFVELGAEHGTHGEGAGRLPVDDFGRGPLPAPEEGSP